MSSRALIILLVYLFCCCPALAGPHFVYNLNVGNGLPGNFVYCLLADHHGYLWCSGKEGVCKYNGYKVTTFNLSDGLAVEDIWRLYEDKKGRVWLSGIARELGYIQQDRYHNLVGPTRALLYPRELRDYDNGVFFFGEDTARFKTSKLAYYTVGDTLRSVRLEQGMAHYVSNMKGEFLLRRSDSLFLGRIRNRNSTSIYIETSYINRTADTLPGELRFWVGNYIFFKAGEQQTIGRYSLIDGALTFISAASIVGKEDKIERFFFYNDNYYGDVQLGLLTTKAVYRVGADAVFRHVCDIRQVTQGQADGEEVTFYLKDSLWHECIATSNKGVLVHYPVTNEFVPVQVSDAEDCRSAGVLPGGIHCWWNNNLKALALPVSPNRWTYRKLGIAGNVKCIVRYSDDSSLIVTDHTMLWIDRYFRITDFFKAFRWQSSYNPTGKVQAFYPVLQKAIVIGRGNILALSNGKSMISLLFRKDSLKTVEPLNERLADLAWRPTDTTIWLAGSDFIKIYRQDHLVAEVSPDSLRKIGIRNIKNMEIDAFGNVFVKEYGRILMFNGNIEMHRSLFPEYVLDGSMMCLKGNITAVAGKFGILFCRIKGPMQLGRPVVYRNVKSLQYSSVSDMQSHDSVVVLKTNKGLCSVRIPADSVLDKNERTQIDPLFRLLLIGGDSIVTMHPGDTIFLHQEVSKLKFDCINPIGIGSLQLKYKIAGFDSQWHSFNNGELVLPKLQTGNFYRLTVVASDEAWRSMPVSLLLYLNPHWWQQTFWQRLFWISGALIFFVFTYLVILITHRIATRKNEERNKRLELELKAIYSQINPHFIYNTLNSALLLIHKNKADEAYTHVSRFSQLLRSYVRSSRNKYITVEEEVTNLVHYIELQQVRFKDKFNYTIDVTQDVHAAGVRIPSLLIQPFVENAINHGLAGLERTGVLDIRFYMGKEPGQLFCRIEDNGVGRKKAAADNQQKLSRESYGNQLVKELTDIFNKYEHVRIKISTMDKESPTTGTIVLIEIKNVTYE